ncbi:MAG: alpha/beta hydrolase [Geminicoccaceae bacterium]
MLYRGFATQEEIDAGYNNMAAVPDAPALLADWAQRSAAARDLPCARLRLAYGPTRAEKLDLFTAGAGTPLHIFVHGGYWRSLSAADFSFLAPTFVAAGISLAVIDYALCPTVTMDEIVRQVRAAVAWCKVRSDVHGCDAGRLSISGHSAGGHLTGMALLTDWARDYDLPADTLRAGVPISGLFDLAPFPYSYLQPKLQLDWGQVRRNSPILHLPRAMPPMTVAVGAAELPELVRQSYDFAAAATTAGLQATYLPVGERNHFTILNDLCEPSTALFQAIRTAAY